MKGGNLSVQRERTGWQFSEGQRKCGWLCLFPNAGITHERGATQRYATHVQDVVENRLMKVYDTHDSCTSYLGEAMRTNIEIDDELMERALTLSGLRTKREVVEKALTTLVRLEEQQQLSELRGKLVWEDDLDRMRGAE